MTARTTHKFRPSEIKSGNINLGAKNRDFWERFTGRLDIRTEWGVLYDRTISKHSKNKTKSLWLGRTITKKFTPGEILAFTILDDRTVRMEVA